VTLPQNRRFALRLPGRARHRACRHDHPGEIVTLAPECVRGRFDPFADRRMMFAVEQQVADPRMSAVKGAQMVYRVCEAAARFDACRAQMARHESVTRAAIGIKQHRQQICDSGCRCGSGRAGRHGASEIVCHLHAMTLHPLLIAKRVKAGFMGRYPYRDLA